jgi:protein involved in polysaccharide export with SLBB domain
MNVPSSLSICHYKSIIIILTLLVISYSQDEVNTPSHITDLTNKGVYIPGDAVRITLPLDSTSFLNGTYPIDDSGYIDLPVEGQYRISSQSSIDVVTFIQKRYEQYLRFPEVQVSPLIRVSLLGGFIRPGLYYIEPQRSMWDIILLAGGTANEKGLEKMQWKRNHKTLYKDLIPFVESGKSLRSIGFRTGDQLWTPGESRGFAESLIRDVLPFATFFLSLYVGMNTIRDR